MTRLHVGLISIFLVGIVLVWQRLRYQQSAHHDHITGSRSVLSATCMPCNATSTPTCPPSASPSIECSPCVPTSCNCNPPPPVTQLVTNCAGAPTDRAPLFPYANMEPMPNLVGPEASVVHPPRNRQLVVAVGGIGDVQTIDAAFNRFGIGTPLASSVTFMLFHYDDNPIPWMAKPWYSSVIRISVHKQMKWWYFKRFLHPDVTDPYEYIWLIDGDVDITRMQPYRYLHILQMFKVQLSAPSHCPGSANFRDGTAQATGYDPNPNINLDQSPVGPLLYGINDSPLNRSFPERAIATGAHVFPHPAVTDTNEAKVGTWHLSVECGPVQVISRATWRCIWGLFRPDMASGWGYDLYWGGICGQGRTAIIDSQCVTHFNKKVASTQYNNAQKEYDEVGKILKGVGEPQWSDAERVTPATKKNVWHGPIRPMMLADLDEPYRKQYEQLL